MDLSNKNKNSIAFLRYLFAGFVILGHSSLLGGFSTIREANISNTLFHFGGVGIAGFFILSGYLICSSYIRINSFFLFLWHRFLRIFPAYWMCLFIVGIVFGPLVYFYEHHTFNNYFTFSNGGPFNFIINNFFLKLTQKNINGIFEANFYPNRVDDSLWTLFYEFLCYLSIGFLGLLRLIKREIFLLALLTLYTAHSLLLILFRDNIYFNQIIFLIRLPMFFYAGATFYLYRDKIKDKLSIFIICVAIFMLTLFTGTYLFVAPFLGAYILFYLCIHLPVRNFDKYGDLSYGLYIYTFFIQQALILVRVNIWGSVTFFLLSMILGSILGYFSFRYIEQPAINLKNRPITSWFS